MRDSHPVDGKESRPSELGSHSCHDWLASAPELTQRFSHLQRTIRKSRPFETAIAHRQVIKEVEDIYRLLYIQSSNVSKGVEAIKEQIADSEVRAQILDFIAASDKGIIKGLI